MGTSQHIPGLSALSKPVIQTLALVMWRQIRRRCFLARHKVKNMRRPGGERGNMGNVCKDAGYLRKIGRHDCWIIVEIHPQRFRFKNWSATNGLCWISKKSLVTSFAYSLLLCKRKKMKSSFDSVGVSINAQVNKTIIQKAIYVEHHKTPNWFSSGVSNQQNI